MRNKRGGERKSSVKGHYRTRASGMRVRVKSHVRTKTIYSIVPLLVSLIVASISILASIGKEEGFFALAAMVAIGSIFTLANRFSEAWVTHLKGAIRVAVSLLVDFFKADGGRDK
ncbi:hypothetical protein GCM10017673_36080 [Streptosporangium violaceochromogenes]|nr:hypothetical protein GCM10017673_36080 [Streptosporangium violaceochromogenes]